MAEASYVFRHEAGNPAMFGNQPPSISTATLPDGKVEEPYSATVSASDINGDDVTLSTSPGALPPGLAMDASGTISGTPSSIGSYSFTVTADDGKGGMRTANLSISVPNTPPTILTGSLPDGAAGTAYSATLSASEPDGETVVWTLDSGSLPPGLSLEDNGSISGIPSDSRTWSFGVRATGPSGASDTASLSITTPNQPPVVATSTLPEANARFAYSATLAASDPESKSIT